MPMTRRTGTPRRAVAAMIAPCVWPSPCLPLYAQRFINYDARTRAVGSANAMTNAPTTDGWRRSFADQSQSQFAEQFANEIVLEATTLAKDRRSRHPPSAAGPRAAISRPRSANDSPA